MRGATRTSHRLANRCGCDKKKHRLRYARINILDGLHSPIFAWVISVGKPVMYTLVFCDFAAAVPIPALVGLVVCVVSKRNTNQTAKKKTRGTTGQQH